MLKIRAALQRLAALGDGLRPLHAVLAISILSVLVKLAYILTLGGGLTTLPTEGTDGGVFDLAARILLAHGVYGLDPAQPMVQPPPGEAGWLALLYAVSGNSLAFAKLAHVALLTLVAVLTYFTGKLFFSPAVGLGAGLLLAIDPAQAYLAGTFLSEPLFILAMTLGLYLLLRGRVPGTRLWWAVGAGLCFGVAGLTRNQGLTFAGVALVGAVVTWGRLLPLRVAAVALGVALVVIAPWTYRNYVVSGHFIPISTNGGLTLWSSNNPEFGWRQPMPMSLPIYAAPAGLSAYEQDHYYNDLAMTWITGHPGAFLVNGLKKEIMLFNFDPASARPQVALLYQLVGIIPYGLCLPFILLGLLDSVRRPQLWLILAYIVMIMGVAFLFWGDSRVRAPIQPYLYLLGVAWVVQWARVRVPGPARQPGATASLSGESVAR